MTPPRALLMVGWFVVAAFSRYPGYCEVGQACGCLLGTTLQGDMT